MTNLYKGKIKIKVIYCPLKFSSSVSTQNMRSYIWAHIQIIEINFIKMQQQVKFSPNTVNLSDGFETLSLNQWCYHALLKMVIKLIVNGVVHKHSHFFFLKP